MVDVRQDQQKANRSSNKDQVPRPPGFEALKKGMGNLANPVGGATTQQGERAQDLAKDVVWIYGAL
jgi:hypothetical protein